MASCISNIQDCHKIAKRNNCWQLIFPIAFWDLNFDFWQPNSVTYGKLHQ